MISPRRIFPILLALLLAAPMAAAAQANTIVILVRHAEKVTTNPNDRDPPLSPAGQARAEALVGAVVEAGIDAIITTNLRRTQLTAAPLAEGLEITPEVIPAGSPTHVADVVAAVRRHAGKTVLVVGHSNTVPAIVSALGGTREDDLCDSQYANLFVLILGADGYAKTIRSHYGAPDPAPGPECARTMRR